MSVNLLEVRGLRKSFGGVAALKDAQFQLNSGSIHALCGGNGAGKSTFLSIIMGIHARDSGSIKRNGVEVIFNTPAEALHSGIAIIEQELSYVPGMSVAENIFLGREPLGPFGGVDFASMNHAAKTLLDELGFDISPKEILVNLTVAQLQLIEIAKALSYDSEILIMDEPTSALGEREVEQLFEAILQLKENGKSIIYVSHRLSEIFQVADSYTVFRDGSFVKTGSLKEVTRSSLIQMIVGRPLAEEFVKENSSTEKVVLEVDNLRIGRLEEVVSFKAFAGEILAVYGLMGSGRTEIIESIFGLAPERNCNIKIDGLKVDINSPKEAIEHGLAFVTEDRKGNGLVMTENVRANICLAHLEKLGFGQIMNQKSESKATQNMIDLFKIKTASQKLKVSALSGGNQQKVILGKWFLTEPRILLLDEPTRGVDVGAKHEIYQIMSDFASNGSAIIMASSEIDEVLGMADRVIIVRDGIISGVRVRSEITAEAMLNLAA